MANSYYNPSGSPGTGTFGLSSIMRGEFINISAAFDLLPGIAGNGGKVVVINPGGTAMTVTAGTLALAGNLSTTGAFNTVFAQGANVTLTLPTINGTLATLAGTETLTNKTLVAPALGTPVSGVATNLTGTAAGLTAGTATNQVGGSVAATTLSASGSVSGAGFVALHAAPGPIGSVTPSTGAFTALSWNGQLSAAGFSMRSSDGAVDWGIPGGNAPTFLDFHSSASATDYDVRFFFSGGTAANGAGNLTITLGTLTLAAAILALPAGTTVPTAAPGTNTTYPATTAFTTAAVLVETNRATTAEGTNATAIATNATAISTETTNRTAADAAVATLVSHNVGRNYLHNSLFNVTQRGAGPFTVTSNYTLDRWLLNLVSDTASVATSLISDAGRTAIGDEEAIQSLGNTFTGNAAAGAFNNVTQLIESLRRLAGKTVTVSFWAIATSGTPNLGISIDQYFGTGGSPSAQVNGNGIAVVLSTTWTRYTVTFAVPSIIGKTLGSNNDHATVLRFWYSSGATNATRAGNVGVQSNGIALWGVQLEVGSVVTPLEKPDPRYDLSNCQRFFTALSVYYFNAYATLGAAFYSTFLMPTTMRASPTITFANQAYVNASGLTFNAITKTGGTLFAISSVTGNASAQADIGLSADL